MTDLLNDGRTILVAGNGLLYDLSAHAKSLGVVLQSTGSPLRWDVPPVDRASESWKDDFPVVAAAIDRLRASDASKTDFDVCDSIALAARRGTVTADVGANLAQLELRHLLVQAFSSFDASVNTDLLDAWGWVEILEAASGTLGGVISFNYDSVIERGLRAAGLWPRYLGVGGAVSRECKSRQVPVWKIHGSANFDVTPQADLARPTYPLTEQDLHWPASTSSSVERVSLAFPVAPQVRRAADIVLPAEHNVFARAPWQLEGQVWASQALRHASCCILAGLSFWRVDQIELKTLIGQLDPTCRIIVANPSPPLELSRWLRVVGRGYEVALGVSDLKRLLLDSPT